jgi:hypothetical protein
MKLKVLVVSMMVLMGTTFAMATATTPTQSTIVVEEEDTWFGDSYEEDGCYCN